MRSLGATTPLRPSTEAGIKHGSAAALAPITPRVKNRRRVSGRRGWSFMRGSLLTLAWGFDRLTGCCIGRRTIASPPFAEPIERVMRIGYCTRCSRTTSATHSLADLPGWFTLGGYACQAAWQEPSVQPRRKESGEQPPPESEDKTYSIGAHLGAYRGLPSRIASH